MKTSKTILATLLFLSTLNLPLSTAFAQGTAFTYQGQLQNNGSPANGIYDFQFVMYYAATGGPAILSLQRPATAVTNGLFTLTLDYGTNIPAALFSGGARWLEIAVKTNGGSVFTIVAPRQQVTPTPYAITAGSVVNGGLPTTYSNVVTFNNPGNSFTGDGSGLTGVWKIGGNAGTSSDFIGTTDDQPFDIRVNNVRVMRYRLNTDGGGIYTNAPNLIGGSSVNTTVTTSIVGATIAGGGGNDTGGNAYPNRVTANFGTVGGGANNTANGFAATAGGGEYNTASGSYATIPGGYGNIATDNALAAGHRAKADNQGSFVWADSSEYDFHSATANQFAVRCTGGAKFVTLIDSFGVGTAGVRLQAGDTAWSSISDRNQKKNFQPVDGEAVLEKLAKMPVQAWNYTWEEDTNTPHLGPMAQDFKAAFYPGRDDKSINTLEFDGVELAAIQGLNQKLEAEVKRGRDKDTQISMLQERLARLEAALTEMTKDRK
jgi:hypothetical protein